MAKLSEKQTAIALRKKGFSYNEIRDRLKVSKSTLSLWLRSIGLARQHVHRLTDKQRISQQKAVAKWHQLKVDRTFKIKNEAAVDVGALSKRERWLIGVALYWAEGSKERSKGVPLTFSNSDPRMVSFFRHWILEFLKVSPEDLQYELYIHEHSKRMNEAIRFWTSLLNLHPGRLAIRFKRHNPSPRRKNTGTDYNGLIRIKARKSTDMNRKIEGWIQGIVKS